MLIPSLTVIVPNSSATPPLARTPFFALSASRRSDALHGVTSFQAEAIPICGFCQSSSVKPTARNIARAAAFWLPSVTSRLRGLTSTGVSVGLVIATQATCDHSIGVCKQHSTRCHANSRTHLRQLIGLQTNHNTLTCRQGALDNAVMTEKL